MEDEQTLSLIEKLVSLKRADEHPYATTKDYDEGVDDCIDIIKAMGDASTRKDEDANVPSEQPSPACSEISVVDEPSLRRLLFEAICQDKSENIANANVADRAAKRVLEVIRPYLCQPEPVSGKPDAATALSQAILEAHAKWQAEYQGVGHVE